MGEPRVNWHGSFAVNVTPFTADGDIDEDAYRRNVENVTDAGCHGLIAAGSTGEFFLMTLEERKRVFSIAVDQVAGRIPVLAGTSATRTADVVDLTQHAREIGCDGVLLLPPIYIGIDDRELTEFYVRVSEDGGLPIMLYNSPLAVQENMTARFILELSEVANIVAVKDSSRDLQQIADLIRFCGDRLRIFVGEENQLLAGMAMGADGAVAMVPQVVGGMAVELYEAAAAGETERAQQLHEKVKRVYDLFDVGSGYVCMKESMNMLGKPGGYSRPPMLPLTEGQRAQLRRIYEDVGLLETVAVG